VPELGVTETTVGGEMNHEPFCTQPLLVPFFSDAYKYMFLAEAANAELNVSATFIVALLPDVLYEDPVPESVHWLFETVADEPGVTPADKAVPASFFR
jgi:hypothetical protein